MNKKVLIGLGVLAVAGIGLYMWKRNKGVSKSDKKSESKPEEKAEEKSKFSNALGVSTNTMTATQYAQSQGLALPPQLIAPAGYEYYLNPNVTNQKTCEGMLCVYAWSRCWCLGYKTKMQYGGKEYDVKW